MADLAARKEPGGQARDALVRERRREAQCHPDHAGYAARRPPRLLWLFRCKNSQS